MGERERRGITRDTKIHKKYSRKPGAIFQGEESVNDGEDIEVEHITKHVCAISEVLRYDESRELIWRLELEIYFSRVSK